MFYIYISEVRVGWWLPPSPLPPIPVFIPVFIPCAPLAISCCSSLSLYTYHLQIKPPLHPQFHIEKPPPWKKISSSTSSNSPLSLIRFLSQVLHLIPQLGSLLAYKCWQVDRECRAGSFHRGFIQLCTRMIGTNNRAGPRS